MEMHIETFLSPLAKASWQSGVLILLILVLQWAFGRRLNPRWRYGLWLLVALRLATPFTPHSPASIFNLTKLATAFRSSESVTTPPEQLASTPVMPFHASIASKQHARQTIPNQPAGSSRPTLFWLLGIWTSGALALTACILAAQWRLSKMFAKQSPVPDSRLLQLFDDCKREMGVRKHVTLVETPDAGSPCLFGFLRPRLLLPTGLSQTFSLDELRHVFLHELAHVKRRDILAGWFMAFLQILHWFNPLVWLAFYRMRVDRELACDALALSHFASDENHRYGNTIIKLLENFGRPAWSPGLAGAVENSNQLAERIRMIARFKKASRAPRWPLALFAGLAVVTFTDAATAPSDASNKLIGSWVLVGEKGDIDQAPASGGEVTRITDKDWFARQAVPGTDKALYEMGGTYTFDGSNCAATVKYVNDHFKENFGASFVPKDDDGKPVNLKAYIGKTIRSTVELKGDTLISTIPVQEGVDKARTDVRVRVHADSKPSQSDLAALQGKWLGRDGDDSFTFNFKGTNFEARAIGTNVWFTARFQLFDTTPRQLIGVITKSSNPKETYIGAPLYTIYDLRGDTLIIMYNEKRSAAPAGFDAQHSHKWVLRRQ